MLYHELYHYLKDQFDHAKGDAVWKEAGLQLFQVPFQSEHSDLLFSDAHKQSSEAPYHLLSDQAVRENRAFTYPVLMERGKNAGEHVIVMLHGLNERTWEKYLPWASALVQRTGYPVILFPISFHMNRSPGEWHNPRLMNDLSHQRKTEHLTLADSSYVNVAISERLEEKPQRFFVSGLETYLDLLKLARSIRRGLHPLFSRKPQIHFFGYSIGTFLTQIMLMANPERLFTKSKAFFFCGGATFDKLNIHSKFIVDQDASEKVQGFFNNIEKELHSHSNLAKLFNQWQESVYFRAMLGQPRFKKMRMAKFQQWGSRVKVAALEQDGVVPADAVVETFQDRRGRLISPVSRLDFPYPYTHENPFPHRFPRWHQAVDNAFNAFFNQVAGHFSNRPL